MTKFCLGSERRLSPASRAPETKVERVSYDVITPSAALSYTFFYL